MGGGKLTRPDFDMAQPDKKHPMTEFYILLEAALNKSPTFFLPGQYVAFKPPHDEMLYAEDIRGHCKFESTAQSGYREIFAPYKLSVLYDELHVTNDGTPSALLLADEHTHLLTGVQLIPPMTLDALPKVPDCTCAISLALTMNDMLLIDADPAALGKSLLTRISGKAWLHHPKTEKWLSEALFAQQRAWRRDHL